MAVYKRLINWRVCWGEIVYRIQGPQTEVKQFDVFSRFPVCNWQKSALQADSQFPVLNPPFTLVIGSKDEIYGPILGHFLWNPLSHLKDPPSKTD